jgi:hypothetical protein
MSLMVKDLKALGVEITAFGDERFRAEVARWVGCRGTEARRVRFPERTRGLGRLAGHMDDRIRDGSLLAFIPPQAGS